MPIGQVGLAHFWQVPSDPGNMDREPEPCCFKALIMLNAGGLFGNLIQYMLKKTPISFSSPLFIYMHGNGKIASVKSEKLIIHLQRTCKRRIIPTTVCISLQKSSSNSDEEAIDQNQETGMTRKLQRGNATKLAKCLQTQTCQNRRNP